MAPMRVLLDSGHLVVSQVERDTVKPFAKQFTQICSCWMHDNPNSVNCGSVNNMNKS